MYYPYVRGKQYELLMVRENAPALAAAQFIPIIEPVKQALGGLTRALDAVCEANGQAIVIVNPYHGDHAKGGDKILAMLADRFADQPGVTPGVFLDQDMSVAEAIALCDTYEAAPLTLIHAGFSDGKALADALGAKSETSRHVFIDPKCGKLYRKHFSGPKRVLLKDAFERRTNRLYPDVEPFSDLHVTYADEGMSGFGDFLIVGDDYNEGGGGPAYAVAIHLTFIDPDKDDAMFIYHFKSKRQDTPTDPAGKFGEALDVLIMKLNSGNSKIFESDAVKELRALHAKKHFPGLGYIKKLSMQHHIETLADYLQ